MGQKYGQHFLSDTNILEKIAFEIEQLSQELSIQHIIEIGPGKWVLTKYIIKLQKPLTLFEIDTQLAPVLQKFSPPAQIIRGDILEQDLSSFQQQETLVVGNLPYYITSPIFRTCFESNTFIGGVFLIQKEVAEKIKTNAKKKSFLRWILNYHYHIDYCFSVPATAFHPAPKVESAVVRFHQTSVQECDFWKLLYVLDKISGYKRKTLANCLKLSWLSLDLAKIPTTLLQKRLEELSREEMILLVKNW